jgi:purine-binding chemotaxis protein CheW
MMDTVESLGTARAGGQQHLWLTFRLGAEAYGVDILEVQEIRAYAPVTPVPKSPAHVRGVMNLRGTVIPVLDLRTLLGAPEAPTTVPPVIVVVHVARRVLGLVVDAVDDVVTVEPDHVQPVPECGQRAASRAVTGVAQLPNGLAVLLALDALLGQSATSAAESPSQ